MPPTPPKPELSEAHKTQLLAHAENSAENVLHHKKHRVHQHHTFSSTGAGLPHKMKNIIKRGGHGSSSSTSSSIVPESAIEDVKDEDGGSGDETGYDGAKESEGDKEGKSGGKREQGHIGRHGSFSHGGAGMPGKMFDRILKK